MPLFDFLSLLQAGEINYGFDEYGIISQVGTFACQLGEGAEKRAAAGYVHLTNGSLEGCGTHVRSESIDDVLSVVLIQKH